MASDWFRCILVISFKRDISIRSPFAAKSKRAGTGKSRLTPVSTPAEDTSKPEQFSNGEAAEDSDYDTDLEYEQPREEYDPTGKDA